MSQNFIACDRGQVFLLPPSMTDWLAEDHLVWLVLGAVDQMTLGRFYGAYRPNGQGRAAYDPRMMGWIQLVVATPDVEELPWAGRIALWIVPLQQGRVVLDVRLLDVGNIRSGSGRRSLEVHQASTLGRRRGSCRLLVSGWFRKGGGMPFLTLAPVSGRYLSFAGREEIAVLLAGGSGVREIARQLGRAPSTIPRELQRNAAIRTGRPEYRASTAQTHADVAPDDPIRRSSL